MKTLWVDCDDTLILWEKGATAPNGLYMGSEWQKNEPLIEAIRSWEGPVMVWSGGGKDYARMWAERCEIDCDATWDKFGPNMKLVSEQDVCVDDQPLKVAGKVLTAEQFISGVAQ